MLDDPPLAGLARGRRTLRRIVLQRPGEACRLHRIIRVGAALPPALATGVFVDFLVLVVEQVRVGDRGSVVRHSIEQVVVLQHAAWRRQQRVEV